MCVNVGSLSECSFLSSTLCCMHIHICITTVLVLIVMAFSSCTGMVYLCIHTRTAIFITYITDVLLLQFFPPHTPLSGIPLINFACNSEIEHKLCWIRLAPLSHPLSSLQPTRIFVSYPYTIHIVITFCCLHFHQLTHCRWSEIMRWCFLMKLDLMLILKKTTTTIQGSE